MSNWAAIRSNTLYPRLTESEQQNNALIIANYFRAAGWTDNAIAGILGNMDIESNGLNPNQFQIGYPLGTESGGFGLVQWTPRTKFSSWAGADWETNYDKQLDRIIYELNNGLQWIPVSGYGYMTFSQFTQSTASPEYLVMAFEYSYERGTPLTDRREAAARKWYEYLTGHPSPGPIPKWMLFKIRWNNFNGGGN